MAVVVNAGDVLLGKYRVERVIGEGGMGVVLAAMHLGLDRRVALKLLRPEVARVPEVLERFQREVRAAAKMEGPHVARVLDVDALDDGTPFFVMEYLDGADLSSVRRSGRALLPAVAVGHVLEACEAVAEAHELGVVHRDLKPANLFVAKRRGGRTEIKVLDFGISKLGGPGEPDSGLTGTAVAMGSAEFMSPEQMRSARDVDARTDIWALGAILYELCTARGAFASVSTAASCASVLHDAPAPPRSLAPAIPPGLEQVILRCLEKDRAHRYATVADLAAALAPFAVGVVAPPSRESLVSLPTLLPPPQAPRGVPLPVIVGVVAAALALVIGAYVLGRGGTAPAVAKGAPIASSAPFAPVRPPPTPTAAPRPTLFPSPGR